MISLAVTAIANLVSYDILITVYVILLPPSNLNFSVFGIEPVKLMLYVSLNFSNDGYLLKRFKDSVLPY